MRNQSGPVIHRIDSPARFACRVCRRQMEITQPNFNDPDTLIGSCNECDRLYLIETSDNGATEVMSRLRRRAGASIGTPRSR